MLFLCLEVLFLEVEVGLNDEVDVGGIEVATAVFLGLVAYSLRNSLHVYIHLVVAGLKNAAGEVIVDDGIHQVEDVMVAVMLHVGGQLGADKRQLALVLLFVEP